MPEVEGRVSGAYTGSRPNTYVLYIKGKKYWGKGSVPVRRGDFVRLTYVENKGYLNIVGTPQKIAAPQEQPPTVAQKRYLTRTAAQELRIARESLIGSLCTLYSGKNIDIERIIALAKRLEKYVYEGV